MCHNKKNETAKAVPSILYTKEANASHEQAVADLKVPDPAPQKAIAVLKGDDAKESPDESKRHKGV